MVATLLPGQRRRDDKFRLFDSIVVLDPEYVVQSAVEDLLVERARIVGFWEDQGINAGSWLRAEPRIDHHHVPYNSESGRSSLEIT